MAALSSLDALSKQLINPDTHEQTLHAILQLSARGNDVAQVAERIVRNCLYTPVGTNANNLSLALDVLIASPSHAFWVDVLAVLVDNLRKQGTAACLVVLLKIPVLPHAALQHLLLYCSTSLIACLSDDASVSIRHAAVHAIASLVLRTRPLTASAIDSVRLEVIDDSHVTVIRRAIERLLFALLEAVFDRTDSVAATALSLLTAYAHSAHNLPEHAPLNATKCSTAHTIWNILIASLPRLSDRFAQVFGSSASSSKSSLSNTTSQFRLLKQCNSSFAKMAANVLQLPVTDGGNPDAPENDIDNAQRRAIRWVDTVLLILCDHTNVELAASACTCLLLVCSFSSNNPSGEKIVNWGMRAVRNIIRLLSQDKKPMPSIVASGLVRDAIAALAALGKSDLVTTKFVISSAISLLPFAATCPGKERRLQCVSLIALTVVEYDLSGRDNGIATALKAVLKSDCWRSVMAENKKDSNVSSEVICCFAASLLHSSAKINSCADLDLRLNLTHTWAVMLSHLMRSSLECLGWPSSPACSYAKEMFLKLFNAAGQYSSYLMRSQGIGMEEYERMQEMVVKATLEQQEVGVQASLLVCVSKYWLTSGMKAESNAGHMLKAIWNHIQQHYRDEELLLNELKTGALWSNAKAGSKTVADRRVEGGYISLATRMGKRTRAVLDTVGTSVSTAIEQHLFGSIALSTAAAEGSTLTTDYIYSGLSALIGLVGHNHGLAEKGIEMLKKYIGIMEQAESADYIALEAVRNTIAVLEVYQGEFIPKAVAARDLKNIIGEGSENGNNALAWLQDVGSISVFASSRLDDSKRDLSTVSTEEAVLHASASAKKKLTGFCQTTLGDFGKHADDEGIERDCQILNGSCDAFSVVASHRVDSVKGLVIIRVDVGNRCGFRARNVCLSCSCAGAVVPLTNCDNVYVVGCIDVDASVTQTITLAVRKNQGFAGKVYFSLRVKKEEYSETIDTLDEEQSCLPYHIASADVLLLNRPAANCGVDVFRRRSDGMRHSIGFHVFVRKDQSVDLLIDMLQRRSHCLKVVGQMTTFSHVYMLIADSSRGDYVCLGIFAPEANGATGTGACIVYATVRSNFHAYCVAFREECRAWLQPAFRVIFDSENDDQNEGDNEFGLRPQDAFFITDVNSHLSPYQRWRKAHQVRFAL